MTDKERYTLEVCYEVWDNEIGTCIEVGPDRDGLDLIEIRLREDDGTYSSRIAMMPEQAARLAVALTKVLVELE